jgi:hypothetical protein
MPVAHPSGSDDQYLQVPKREKYFDVMGAAVEKCINGHPSASAAL